ncbi:MAG TPA: rod shape-determining protein MreD [Streptosporangiaceae bacterium]|nr:rod shape-determining protein MreD [Streptosporangiaceae bacterium]
MTRKLLAAGALLVALLLQLTIINGLALPGGGTPDLVLICVIAAGMAGGPASGITAGFLAGLALDLAPPASQLVGQYALVFCLIGYGSGRLRFVLRHSAVLAVAAAVAMAALGEAFSAVLTLALDTPEVTRATVAHVLPATMLFDAALVPLVLFCWVRLAVALGARFDPRADSPALENGGSAAPTTMAGVTAVPGIAAMSAVAVGSIGWLAGPATSRRARREHERLTATVAGVTPRKGPVWVGRRPPGVHLLTPAAPQKPRRLARLRPGAGAAGTATARPGPSYHAQFRRPVRLGLADEQRRHARAAGGHGRVKGHVSYGANRHGPDLHGLNGPAVPRIAFGTADAGGRHRHGPTSLAGGRGHGKPHRIAFGTGGLPGEGRAAGRPPPRIAFSTPGLGPAGAGPIGGFQSGAGRGGLIGVGGAAIRSAHGGRKPKQPRFARVTPGRPAKTRQPKTARIGIRHGVFRTPHWLSRPGGRSAVWRIGSRRMSVYR